MNKCLSSFTEFNIFRKEQTKHLYPVGNNFISIFTCTNQFMNFGHCLHISSRIWRLNTAERLAILLCGSSVTSCTNWHFCLAWDKSVAFHQKIESVRLASYFRCISYYLFWYWKLVPKQSDQKLNTFCWCTLQQIEKMRMVKIAQVSNSGCRIPLYLWGTESRKIHFLLWKCYLLTLYIWLRRVKEFAFRNKHP